MCNTSSSVGESSDVFSRNQLRVVAGVYNV